MNTTSNPPTPDVSNSSFNQVDPSAYVAGSSTPSPLKTPFYKNKIFQIIAGAAILIILVILLIFALNQRPTTSLDLTTEQTTGLSQIPITEATLSDRAQLSQTILTWFDSQQITGEPYAGVYNCSPEGACQPSLTTPVHRDSIPLIWARNRSYVQNPHPDQLAKLTLDIDNVYQWTRPKEDGPGFIWQINNYHCYLIEQILNSNQDLSQESRDQLTRVCAEAHDEGYRYPFTFEQENIDTTYAFLSPKIHALTSNDPNFDWNSDQTYNFYQSQDPDFNRDLDNIIYLAEVVSRINVSPYHTANATLLNYLDASINAFRHFQTNPAPTPLEKTLITETMINSLSVFQNQYAESIEEYQFNLPQLITSLKNTSSDLNVQLLLTDLLNQQNLSRISQLCLVEGQPIINYNQKIVNALISYHRADTNRSSRPFFYLADTGDYMIPARENGMLAGCVLYEV